MYNPRHTVQRPDGCSALSPRYIGPLLGNGELSLFLDENGLMHDFAAFPGWPAPRIYWAGRRRNGQDRPLAPFGFFTAAASWEWLESTAWEQTLDVKQGLVLTEHRRGSALDQTETALLLDRNVIALHRHVERLRGTPTLAVSYRLCPPGGVDLPPATTVIGGGQDTNGAWLDYRLDGVVAYTGRILLWANRPCTASWQRHVLTLTLALQADVDAVTVYLGFADDLGDDLLYRQSGWGGRHADHPLLAPVIRDLHQRPVQKGDPVAQLAAWRAWTARRSWQQVRAHQARCWAAYWTTGNVSLPDAPDTQAIWETGMYALRTQLTRWSIPVAIHGDYFNGQYFPDEMSGVKALLQAGHWRLVERIAEHKLSVLPLGMQCVDGAGARGGEAPSFEGGYFHLMPAGCSLYEVHAAAEPSRLIWAWQQYAGMDLSALSRYYPLFWGAAEFFRRWMVYKGPDGRYFTGACVDFNESIPAVVNGAATVAAAVGSMRLAAAAAERLGRDAALVPVWREIADGLSCEVRTNRRGLLAQYEGDEGVAMTTLRQVATPFSNGMLPPEDPRVRRTLETALAECKLAENWAVAAAAPKPGEKLANMDARHPSGITWTWLGAEAVGIAARIRDGELAASVVAELVRCSNNFASLYECKVLADGYLSLPWFVTSSAELTAGISSLLLQCGDDGLIDLLPAVPAAWRNLSFRLAATDHTTVQVAVKDGHLTALRLSGPAGTRRVRIPQRFAPGRLLGRPGTTSAQGVEFNVPVRAARPGTKAARG